VSNPSLPQIQKIITGVTACQSLIHAAIEEKADALLVHHGLFWKGENTVLCGMKRERVKELLAHDLNLMAYHLPLDAHPTVGNNAMLAERLGLTVTERLAIDGNPGLFFMGHFKKPMSAQDVESLIATTLNRKPLTVSNTDKIIESVGWCTGGAQGYIDMAIANGCDAYITGEVSEKTVHVARESNIHFFSAGHHASERYGVQALGTHLAEKFNITHQFIDIDNPV